MKINKQDTSVSKVSVSTAIFFGFADLIDYSFCDNRRDGKFFVDFLQRLRHLSELGWKEIDVSHRHCYGYEKIPVDSLKKSARNKLTKDVRTLLVFRATGDNHVFLGYRDGNTFQIVFIEYNFGDIYNH